LASKRLRPSENSSPTISLRKTESVLAFSKSREYRYAPTLPGPRETQMEKNFI
jgi:hypothetical protein